MDGILAALDAGPANTREIERRMGFRPPTETANLLRILERKGEVRLSGSHRTETLRKNLSFVWARVIHPDKPRSNNKRHSVSSS